MLNIPVPCELKDSLTKAAGNTPDIRIILMVGARLNSLNSRALTQSDDAYLKNTFTICADRGIVIAEDVKVNICNLNYQHDFLELARQGRIRTDMVVYDYLCYAPDLIHVARMDPQVRQSPLATEPGIWHESPIKAGARYVMNVNGRGRYDLPTDFIARYPYQLADSRDIPLIIDGRSHDRTYDLLIR